MARLVENGVASRKWALLTRRRHDGDRPGHVRAARGASRRRLARGTVHLSVRAKLPPDEMLDILPYRLGDLGGFRMLRATPDGTAVLTFGPNDTTLPAEQPYFLMTAVRAAEPPQAAERDLFARRVLMRFMNRPDLDIVSSEQIRFGNAQGHEIIAESIDDRTKDPLMMVQWLRFGAGGTVQMFGMARKDQWADVLPRMRALRDGFGPKVIFARFAARIAGDDNLSIARTRFFPDFPDTAALRCAMAETPVRSSTKLLLAGLFAVAMGVMLLLFASGVVPSKGANAPAWIGVCAGLPFLLAGGALLLRFGLQAAAPTTARCRKARHSGRTPFIILPA